MDFDLDSVFISVLSANNGITALVADRIYDTAIPVPDVDFDNAPVPYIIVSFDGMSNAADSKDNPEGIEDTVRIGIEVAAADREQLSELLTLVRSAIRDAFSTFDLADHPDYPDDFSLSSDPILWDQLKPCYWTVLHYECLKQL